MEVIHLIITLESVFGIKAPWYVGGSILPVYKYENGVRTAIVEAYKVPLIAPGNGYREVIVKVKELPTLPESEEAIPVRLDGFAGKVYLDFNSKEYRLSLSADRLTPVTTGK